MDTSKIPNETDLSQEKIIDLAKRIFELLTEARGVSWNNPQDALALLRASQRSSKALQSIIDCTDEQASLYVMAAIFGESEWLEHPVIKKVITQTGSSQYNDSVQIPPAREAEQFLRPPGKDPAQTWYRTNTPRLGVGNVVEWAQDCDIACSPALFAEGDQ